MLFSLLKEAVFLYKLMYKRCLELICRCLSDDMYIELINMRIPHRELTCVYGKAFVMIM